MNLQLSPIGIGLLALLWLVCTGVLFVLLSQRFKGRTGWLIALGALPSLGLLCEELWIAWRFGELCKGAGVHVVRTVEVEGYLTSTSPSSPQTVKLGTFDWPEAIKAFDKAGFRFTEELLNDGTVRHVERVEGGLRATILQRPTARYHYKHAYQPTPHQYEEPVGWKLKKWELIVVDSQANETIARDVGFKRYPSIIEGIWIRLLGSGLTLCPDPGKAPPPGTIREHLPRAAIKPLRAQ